MVLCLQSTCMLTRTFNVGNNSYRCHNQIYELYIVFKVDVTYLKLNHHTGPKNVMDIVSFYNWLHFCPICSKLRLMSDFVFFTCSIDIAELFRNSTQHSASQATLPVSSNKEDTSIFSQFQTYQAPPTIPSGEQPKPSSQVRN